MTAPFSGEFEETAKRLRVPEDCLEEFQDIFEDCLKVGLAKGVFCEYPVWQEGERTHVGDAAFDSRVLQRNFTGLQRAFPYAMCCGRELYDLAQRAEDPLERFWIDSISEIALRQVGGRLRQEVMETYGVGRVNSVNPGSLADFPLPCQRPLFDLLGAGPDRIGLELTETFLMLPYKAGSGIYYESVEHFENCSLCPRAKCPGRRAPYDPKLYRETFGLA